MRKLKNYIINCEKGAMQSMQKKRWMDSFQVMEWMDYFINRMKEKGGVPPIERHLVILDGYKSHVSLEMLQKAKANGIDMVSLSSCTSHELQSLDNVTDIIRVGLS